MLAYLLINLAVFVTIAVGIIYSVARKPSFPSKHRGTPGQVALQTAQRAEREAAWAQSMLTEV